MCSTRDDVGARALRLCLYRVDGAVETIDIGLTLPTRSVSHVARLIDLKLDALAAMEDAGFGFEAIGLAVTRAEPMPARQTELHPSAAGEDGDRAERCAALIDALRQRLGPHRVRRFAAGRQSSSRTRRSAAADRRRSFAALARSRSKRAPAPALAAGRAGRRSRRSSPTVRRGVFAGAA